uniref:Lactamase, beta-like 1a n=1 Tax=Takifugu rubripes TaxID=31033 RepID=A0A674NEX9_TAKRU
MCPRFPQPVPLQHPIAPLKAALAQVDGLLRTSVHTTKLPAVSAIVVLNDSVLWNGNFGRRNISDPSSSAPNEYTVYRIASLSKIFPTLMLYKLWEDGRPGLLDDPLEKFLDEFRHQEPPGWPQERLGSRPVLAGLPRRLRSTNLLWAGDTAEALSLLQDDVLVADPGTRCHYSNVAFSLLADVLAQKVAGSDFESWVSKNILEQLGMEDTGFDLTPTIRQQMAVGVYSTGPPSPALQPGLVPPRGSMFSTAADMARLMMFSWGALAGYFANSTGTPWEVNQQFGYDVLRKDGDLDGYAATLSLVPRLKLGLVILMAGVRPAGPGIWWLRPTDTSSQQFGGFSGKLSRASERRRTRRPNTGFFTYRNMTFYEIKADSDNVLVMQQFGPQVDTSVPSKYRTIRLDYLQERVFRVGLPDASVSLEAQDQQLFNFYPFDKKGASPGFDSPGLNTYKVLRIPGRPFFSP